MYDKSQLMKGTLEGCILRIIQKETTYGYQIASELQRYGLDEVKEGTIYPLLVRLEKKGHISSEFRPSPLGPARKYYSLTGEGEALLQAFSESWRELADSVNRILAGGEEDE